MRIKAGDSASKNGNRNQIYPYRSSLKPSRTSTPQRRPAARPISPVQPEPEMDPAPLDLSSSSSGCSIKDVASDDSIREEVASDDSIREEVASDDSPSGAGSSCPTKAARSATLTDLNVLDCPICYASLFSPVYQCENGHVSCASCCAKMSNKCPNCSRPTGTIRCRALETILDSVKMKCVNAPYGCTETVPYTNKLDHEKKCIHSPCSCPLPNCNHIDTPVSLYTHFSLCHSHSSETFSFLSKITISLDSNRNRVYLQDGSRITLFILDRMVKSPGSFVSLVCVGPDSWKGAFSYDLTAVIDEHTSVSMKAGVECMPIWKADGASEKCIVLPRDLVGARKKLKLELIIWRNPEFR